MLSINPVDFMLVSEHTDGGWRSCHNYIDGGIELVDLVILWINIV